MSQRPRVFFLQKVSRCVCQSAPVRALVVPVCCERGLYLKNSSNPNVARPSVLHTACSKVHMIVVQSTSNASKYVCVRRAAAIVIILIALAVVSSPRASALSRKSFCHLDWRVSCLEPKETDVEPEETGPTPCVTKLMVSRNPACYGTTFPVCDGSPGRSPNSHTQHRP